MSDEPAGGGLHIDGDWKTEAAQEKKRLAEEEATQADKQPGGGADPAATFVELINLLAMQAAIGLGGMQGPTGEQIPPNPLVAKHHIDLLEILRQKTDGNLTEEESGTLTAILYELRQHYVQAMSAPTPDPRTPSA